MPQTRNNKNFWWERKDLKYRDSRLIAAGQDLQTLVESSGTPIFVYNAGRMLEKIALLADALQRKNVTFKIFYALKANRFLPLITNLRLSRRCGVDVCSPAELLLARQVGFLEADITYTGTSVANDDIDLLKRHPGVRVNCDAISTIRRLGAQCPGRSIGIRINPQQGAGYHDGLHYSGEKSTKFGIYPDRFPEALKVAADYSMKVTTLHFHIGSGYLTRDLGILKEILEGCHWFLDQGADMDTLDIGGGMGVPLVAEHDPLDLDAWADIVADCAVNQGVEIHVEPGDYLIKDAGILLLQANTVEDKGGTRFVGVNGGFNIQNLAAYYQTPFIVTPLVWNRNVPLEKVTIAGNINEAIDILAEDVKLPLIAEGDYLALLNAGGYGSASSSNHCMRGTFNEYLL